jgi:hypothetical protein
MIDESAGAADPGLTLGLVSVTGENGATVKRQICDIPWD